MRIPAFGDKQPSRADSSLARIPASRQRAGGAVVSAGAALGRTGGIGRGDPLYTALGEEGADLESTAAGSTHWAWQEGMEALPWWWVPLKRPDPPIDRSESLIDLKHRQGARVTYWQVLEALLIEGQDLRAAEVCFVLPTGQAAVILRSALGDHVRSTDSL